MGLVNRSCLIHFSRLHIIGQVADKIFWCLMIKEKLDQCPEVPMLSICHTYKISSPNK